MKTLNDNPYLNNELMKKESLIDSSTNILSAALSFCGLGGVFAGAALSPIIAEALKGAITNPIEDRSKARMLLVARDAVGKIQRMLDRGLSLRDDESYYSMTSLDIPKAQELFEGVLLKARDEYQSKKLQFYSYFFANLCFDETVSFSHANFLLQTIDRLSYRQLVILAYLSDDKQINSEKWDSQFKVASAELSRYYDFYSEYTDLYNLRLITQCGSLPGFSLGMSNTKISSVGKRIVSLLGLNEIPIGDMNDIKVIINAIDALILR